MEEERHYDAIRRAIRSQLPDTATLDALWRADFKRRTGYDFPQDPAGWRRLMIAAGFTPEQIRDVQEGRWVGYETEDYTIPGQLVWHAGPTSVNFSFCEYLVTRLEQQNRGHQPNDPPNPSPTNPLEHSTPNSQSRHDQQSPNHDHKSDAVAPATKTSRSRSKEQWLAEAMLLVQKYPEWSDARIAREVGKDRGTLSRETTYQVAAGLARQNGYEPPPAAAELD